MQESQPSESSTNFYNKTLISMSKYANNYAVYRVFRDWNKRPKVLMDGLTREQAQTIVRNTPSEEDSMVVFDEDPRSKQWGRR